MRAEDKGVVAAQIADWMRDHVVVAKPGLGRCKHLVLRHVSLAGKPQGDVGRFSIVADEGIVGEIDMYVNRIVEAAQRHADDCASGIQKYALYAHYTDDTSFVPHKIFRVSAEDESARDSVAPSEPATAEGLTSQLMRHLESTQRTSASKDSFTFEILMRQLKTLSEKDARNEQQRLDMIMVMQDALNEAHGRRLKERTEESNVALKEGLFEQIKLLVPIIANRVAGKSVLPEVDKSFLLMANFLETLRPEQQIFLRDSLDGPQVALMAEILGEYEKKKATFTGNKEISQGNVTSNTPTNLPSLPNIPPSVTPFSRLDERINGAETSSSDPIIKQLEEKGANFNSRFNDLVPPPEKTTTQEKK